MPIYGILLSADNVNKIADYEDVSRETILRMTLRCALENSDQQVFIVWDHSGAESKTEIFTYDELEKRFTYHMNIENQIVRLVRK